MQPTTAAEDSAVTLSAGKARELGVAKGDVVVLVGRRRHAAHARVAIASSKAAKKKSSCGISQNLAANLRLRQDDKVKVEPVAVVVVTGDDEEVAASERSGDLLLVQQPPAQIASVTLSPVEDSLRALVASEGGDAIDDAELHSRFVAPYLEGGGGGGLLKKGHLVALRDENNRRLEFYVSHVSLEGAEEEGEPETEGAWHCVCENLGSV